MFFFTIFITIKVFITIYIFPMKLNILFQITFFKNLHKIPVKESGR